MVRQPEYGTNTPYLSDFIEICLCPQLLNSVKIRDLHQRDGKSKAQIAAQFGVSRSTVTSHLHSQGVHGGSGKGRSNNPDNYRNPSKLIEGQTDERQFPDWSMGFRDLNSDEVKLLPGYSEFLNTPLDGEEFRNNPSRCQKLLLNFKKNIR